MKDNVVAFAFIALMGLIIIGSWNGKFSARVEKIPVTETREYRDLVTKMENMKAEDAHQREVTFKYENEVGILVGDRDDSQRKIDELLESVGVPCRTKTTNCERKTIRSGPRFARCRPISKRCGTD
jgi:hypothetical protein